MATQGKSSMKTIFYDRKNKRNVSSDELMSTKLVQQIAVGDDQDVVPTGLRYHPITQEPLSYEDFIELGKCDEGWRNSAWETLRLEKVPRALQLTSQLLADLCYKSENCPSYVNGDLYCLTNDLVFLRLEDEEK